jgi:hypothetical protein
VAVRPDVHYDIIFRELESHFGSESDVVQATTLLDDLFGGLADALWQRPIINRA